MNSNSLKALLFELAYESSSKVSPVSRTAGVPRVTDSAATGKKTIDYGNSGFLPGHTARPEIKQTTEHQANSPAFTPLPLRSGLFKEARFFAKTGWEKEGSVPEDKEASQIFICLVTENLGRIWIGLSCMNDDLLSVRYFTEKEESSKVLKENFSPLRKDLIVIGFKEVSLTSQVRTELGKIMEGLLPRFEEHLLDRKI